MSSSDRKRPNRRAQAALTPFSRDEYSGVEPDPDAPEFGSPPASPAPPQQPKTPPKPSSNNSGKRPERGSAPFTIPQPKQIRPPSAGRSRADFNTPPSSLGSNAESMLSDSVGSLDRSVDPMPDGSSEPMPSDNSTSPYAYGQYAYYRGQTTVMTPANAGTNISQSSPAYYRPSNPDLSRVDPRNSSQQNPGPTWNPQTRSWEYGGLSNPYNPNIAGQPRQGRFGR